MPLAVPVPRCHILRVARPLRVEFPGALYHVTARGNAGQTIYLDDKDRRRFLELYADVSERLNWLCHAYCLMTNHYHFVIETIEPNLSKGMQQLNSTYAQWFNRHHNRHGHLFQGRFKAIIVQRGSYLLELARYVVLNPQRAGLVRDALHWPWSSYRATSGMAPAPSWLTTDWILSQFGATRDAAINAYRAFVAEGIRSNTPWDHLRGQIYLGEHSFAERVKRTVRNAANLSEVPRTQRIPEKSLASYERETRDSALAMLLAYQSGAYALKEIARHFGIHYSTVSKRIKRRRHQIQTRAG